MQETTAHESQSHKPQSAAARWAGGVGRILIKWVLGIAAAVAGLLVLTWKAAHGGGKSTAEDAAAAAAAASSAGFKATLTGGAGLAWGGWTSNDIAMLGGLVLGVIGLLVQIHFKRREYALRHAEHLMTKREHEARMSEMEGHK